MQEPPGAHRVRDLARRQACVVARRQVLEAGLTEEWVDRQVVARRWQRVHRGIYTTFTGLLSWEARCWAALLYAGAGAVLADEAALRAAGMTLPTAADGAITVAVDHGRRVRATAKVKVFRVKDLARFVDPARRPPRLRLEPALLLKASRARRAVDAIAVLADACQQRLTTPERLGEWLAAMPDNLRHRKAIGEVLTDVAAGAYSFLEIHYLRDVERPHGLPTAKRQRRVSAGRRVWFRDVDYVGLALIVELDGRLGHETFGERAEDMTRDNVAEVDGKRTLRVG